MDAATCTELKPEQALAKRWLRGGGVPLPIWKWLCGRTVTLSECLPPAPALLSKSLEAFAEPLGAHSGTAERETLANCLNNAAHVLNLCFRQTPGPARACQQRMLAASLLPLYRGLARGSVAEVTSVLRRQLADAVAINLTLIEFRDELLDVMCTAMADDQTPYQKLKAVSQLELEQLSQALLNAGAKWDGNDATQLNAIVREELKVDWRPAWGQPAVLWRLAGELISQRAEFVVPRDWIDVPVPWSQASEHWLDIVHALEQSSGSSQPIHATDAALADASWHSSASGPSPCTLSVSSAAGTTPAAANAVPSDGTLNDTRPAASQQTGSVQSMSSAAATGSVSNGPLSTSANAAAADDIQRLKLEIEIADAVDSLVQASRHATGQAIGNRKDGSHGEASPRPRNEEFVVPKVIIAEVRSHNDPAFVSVVRRQLAVCRSEGRTMSLIAVTVTPEAEDGPMPTLQSLGLATWQQKLVNWISDHPEIHDPYAFVSNEGELILSLMDIERNTATLLLRQGLTKVLSSAAEAEDSLSRASLPARYNSGIGSVSSPKASFEPEELVEATYRCLDAASRQGKASIKSIEVF